MLFKVFTGALIPLIGTTVGALFSFICPEKSTDKFSSLISGLASGVMVAASVWSLLLPSIEYADSYGTFSFVPAVAGLFAGVLFMMLSDKFIEKISSAYRNRKHNFLYFAVTLHNVPEGMAIGAAYAAFLYERTEALLLSAFLLSFGIAIQNIPEGAIVALPFAETKGKRKGFFYGVLSGAVEPVAVFVTVLLSSLLVPVLSYMLSFAAGAMIFVVFSELSGDFTNGTEKEKGITAFVSGFSLMMSLDVAFG